MELVYTLIVVAALYALFHVLKNIGKKKAKIVKMEQPPIEDWEEKISSS